MSRLSIVIPCLREAADFEATLASVLQNRPENCEVLVVQPRGYNDPYELKNEVRFVEAQADSTLIDLINVGIQKAAGEIIHVLSCEVEVFEGWTEPALRHFQNPTVGSVSPLVAVKGSLEQVVSRGVLYDPGGVRTSRSEADAQECRALGRYLDAPTLSAGLYRRVAVLEVGGFCPEVGPVFADVDLGLMLRAFGYRCIHEENSVVTTEHPPCAERLSFANGRAVERLFWRNTDPSDWICILLNHPATWLAECVCNLHHPRIVLQFMGRVLGLVERVVGRHHKRRLRLPRAKSCQARPGDASPDSSSGSERGRPPDARVAA